VPALQGQSLEFKLQNHQKKKKEKEQTRNIYKTHCAAGLVCQVFLNA
jgi:hypothetical protein